jgi:hypothetical protein
MAVVIAALATVVPALPAAAHEGDSDQARVLVLDALAYLANQPDGYVDDVTDKVGDALEAPDTEGVDLAKVRAAQASLESGDLTQVRADLQDSVEPLTERVTGEEPGTTTMLDPLPGRDGWTGGDTVLVVLSVLVLLAGVVLAIRWRPEESLHDLRVRAERNPS